MPEKFLLDNETAICFQPRLASVFGLPNAAILQTIHYHAWVNSQRTGAAYEESWVVGTYDELIRDVFNWYKSDRGLQKALCKLEVEQLIIAAQDGWYKRYRCNVPEIEKRIADHTNSSSSNFLKARTADRPLELKTTISSSCVSCFSSPETLKNDEPETPEKDELRIPPLIYKNNYLIPEDLLITPYSPPNLDSGDLEEDFWADDRSDEEKKSCTRTAESNQANQAAQTAETSDRLEDPKPVAPEPQFDTGKPEAIALEQPPVPVKSFEQDPVETRDSEGEKNSAAKKSGERKTKTGRDRRAKDIAQYLQPGLRIATPVLLPELFQVFWGLFSKLWQITGAPGSPDRQSAAIEWVKEIESRRQPDEDGAEIAGTIIQGTKIHLAQIEGIVARSGWVPQIVAGERYLRGKGSEAPHWERALANESQADPLRDKFWDAYRGHCNFFEVSPGNYDGFIRAWAVRFPDGAGEEGEKAIASLDGYFGIQNERQSMGWRHRIVPGADFVSNSMWEVVDQWAARLKVSVKLYRENRASNQKFGTAKYEGDMGEAYIFAVRAAGGEITPDMAAYLAKKQEERDRAKRSEDPSVVTIDVNSPSPAQSSKLARQAVPLTYEVKPRDWGRMGVLA